MPYLGHYGVTHIGLSPGAFAALWKLHLELELSPQGGKEQGHGLSGTVKLHCLTDERGGTSTPGMHVCIHSTEVPEGSRELQSMQPSHFYTQVKERDNACCWLNICYRKKPQDYINLF